MVWPIKRKRRITYTKVASKTFIAKYTSFDIISNELLHTHTTIEQYARSIYIEEYNKIRIRREILIINDEEIGNGRLTIICRRDTLIAFVVQ